MKFSDMMNVLLIILGFIFLWIISTLIMGLKKIKQNWPKYRCNPSVMPFAGQLGYDSMENFTYCIGNIQMDLMGYFLKPIYFVIELASSLGKDLMESIQSIRGMISWLRFSIFGIITDVLGIFINIISRFQLLVIQMKTLVMKMIAITVVILYKIEGAVMTGKSLYRGPIGDVLRFLGNV
tara:strand:+ start:205 stop:744 length:540 start_codon:yes stop_codon:yes gene_type:complete